MTDVVCHISHAFADDIGFECNDINELILTIRTIEKWSKNYKIEINRIKPGIIIVNDDGTDPNNIEAHSAVSEFKYLGMLLHTKLIPKTHI